MRNLELKKYQQRYTNFTEEEDELRMSQIRQSNEALGRRSITSKMMMRRSSTHIPQQTESAPTVEMTQAVAQENNQRSPRTKSEPERMFSKVENQKQQIPAT